MSAQWLNCCVLPWNSPRKFAYDSLTVKNEYKLCCGSQVRACQTASSMRGEAAYNEQQCVKFPVIASTSFCHTVHFVRPAYLCFCSKVLHFRCSLKTHPLLRATAPLGCAFRLISWNLRSAACSIKINNWDIFLHCISNTITTIALGQYKPPPRQNRSGSGVLILN